MEDVLAVYARPLDPRAPLVCFDEASKQLHGEIRAPIAPAPGHPARQDYEYQRYGNANLLLWYAPQLGQRGITITAQRTSTEWAEAMRQLVDETFPAAERIVLVLDNLNTHTTASLYRTFPPETARRIAEKLEVHYTPKHGSWLNMAELEFSVLTRQCLAGRVGTRAELAARVAAWVADRNALAVTATWRYTIADARRALPDLYPIPPSDIIQ
jgi:hypothetical protein